MSKYVILLICAFLLIGFLTDDTGANETAIPLVINELMASNSSRNRDPQNQYDDWIEIHNSGINVIDVGGMYLTDDMTIPTKWRFPENTPSATRIPAGGYVLIWADNDTGDMGLHANFKLNSDGEEIGLFDSDGITLIDSIVYPAQTTDISYGRFPDAGDDFRFFASPSPAARNDGAYAGQVADLQFSHQRGFYDSSFSVTIATETEDAIIYYTLDGSKPYEVDERGSMNGTVYTHAIPITTTTTLRAIAVKSGFKSTKVDALSYIFLDDVIHQTGTGLPNTWGHAGADYGMDPDVVNNSAYRNTIKDDLKAVPTVSLVMPLEDWFDRNSNPEIGGIYANPGWEDTAGDLAERAVSVEYFDPATSEQFHINAAVRLAGGSSTNPWKMDKLSMRLKFVSQFGETKLKFPVFGDSATDEFDTLVLDARMNNSWAYGGGVGISRSGMGQRDIAQYTRDQFVSDIQNAMGGYAPNGRHVHLYLNGLYWGLYWLHERPDEHFAAAYLRGDDDDYDVLKHNSGNVINGSSSEYNRMISTANAGLRSDEQYESIQQILDVSNLIDYVIANYYVGNTDWAHQNWYATFNRADPDGRWRYHSWDAEHVMEGLNDNVTGRNDSGGPTGLHRRLTDNIEYQMLFADHIHRHFFNDGLLTPAGATDLYQIRLDDVDRAVVGESARWGDNHRSMPYTRNVEWITERDWLLSEYFQRRTAIVLNQFKSRGWYSDVEAPTFYINGAYQHGGSISTRDTLYMEASEETIWYTLNGTDPRQAATSPGNNTSTTLIAENADKRVLVPTGNIGTYWKSGSYYNDSSWIECTGSPGGVGYEHSSGYQDYLSLDLEELMYGRTASCYIRVPFTFDGEPDDFNFMTLNIRYDDGFIAYLNGTEVARRNFNGTPAWNSSASTTHSDSLAVDFEAINISDSLSLLQNGDNLLAIQGLNSSTTSSDLLISVKLIAGQSTSADDDGISRGAIQYTRPITLMHSATVKARVLSGNTWSALNEAIFSVGLVAENLRITEIMYHPQALTDAGEANEEFIELTNIGTETINLNLVRFTNGIDYTFPSLDLAPGEFIVVVQDREAFEAQYSAEIPIVGQFTGRLNNAGERITLEDALGQTILDFNYSDGWRSLTDGEGFSLTIIDPVNPDLNSWNDKDAWRASVYIGGSPGWDDSGLLPNPGDVVINELLANSSGGEPDWIELYNTTGIAIDLGGWFLSDSDDNLFKYEIASGTTIAPNGYLVFFEDVHFGNENDTGCHEPFALSNNGERTILSSGEDDTLTGYREVEDFGASPPGVSFGRYYKSSTGNTNFVLMDSPTPGSENAYPLVGPIVINEIMYNPDWPEGGSFTNDQYEYIELYNISTEPVTLYDADKDTPWAFTNGIDFTFPTDVPVTIPAGGYLLVVKHPEAFIWRYPDVPIEKILGPYDGRLSNAGESLELSKPGDDSYIRIDRINYSDGSHPEDCPGSVDLWPTEPDGAGLSLKRRIPADYGNDPENWIADAPSPGE